MIMPGPKVEPEMMETTTGFHNLIAEIRSPIADFVLDNAKTLDAIDGVFDPDADGRNGPIAGFLVVSERLTARLLLGLHYGDAVEIKGLETGILIQDTVLG